MSAPDTTAPREPIRLLRFHRNRAAEVLSQAFLDAPWAAYLSPNPDDRIRLLRIICKAQLNFCITYGEVYTTAHVNGASCWLFSENSQFTFWRRLRTGMLIMPRRLGRYVQYRLTAIVTPLSEVRKKLMKQSYWYLWALGVEPSCQGKGIGGRLLEPVLLRADSEHLPCYLETHTERNVAFYKRYGFEIVAQGELPVRFWTMLRQPTNRVLSL